MTPTVSSKQVPNLDFRASLFTTTIRGERVPFHTLNTERGISRRSVYPFLGANGAYTAITGERLQLMAQV